MRRRPTISAPAAWSVQLVLCAAFALAFARLDPAARADFRAAIGARSVRVAVPVPRQIPLRIAPLYDRPELVSDADLLAVLKQVQPRFPKEKLKPNFVEHALCIWGVDAEFNDPEVMSGAEMTDFLVNHGKYLASWGSGVAPLLDEQQNGVAIRWGKQTGASVHHDHWLACLTEAGIRLDHRVFTPSQRERTIDDVLQLALRDFRPDERETEWSALAFGLWLAPHKSWKAADGRTVDFDLLARRLMRGQKELGVCSGTHRVYSLMVLVRLDDDYQILSPDVRRQAWSHLEAVRDRIAVSQLPDGRWPANWPDGKAAVESPRTDPLYKQVIATGHHLEWLAIAPEELHPPKEVIEKAVRWIVATTTSQTQAEILERYTFFSHVGGALASWRSVHPAEFWKAKAAAGN